MTDDWVKQQVSTPLDQKIFVESSDDDRRLRARKSWAVAPSTREGMIIGPTTGVMAPRKVLPPNAPKPAAHLHLDGGGSDVLR